MPTGTLVQYNTTFREDVEEQLNAFQGENIAFYLHVSNNRYMVGRFDGSISLYDEKTNMLVGLSSWVTKVSNLTEVGYYRTIIGCYPIFRCNWDFQTLMVGGPRAEGLLPEKNHDLFFPLKDAASFMATNTQRQYLIRTKLGGVIDGIDWSLETHFREQNYRRFV